MFAKNKILGRKKTVQKEISQFLLDVLSIPQNKMISLSAFQFKDLYRGLNSLVIWQGQDIEDLQTNAAITIQLNCLY